MKSAKGFTLIELLITIAVLAILLGIAAPSLTDTLRSNRAQAEVSRLKGMFSYARSEAVQRATTVVVCTPANGDWSVRLASCSGTELRRFERPTVTTVTSNNVPAAGLAFDARGYLSNVSMTAARPTYTMSVSSDCTLGRIVSVQPIGSVAVSPAVCS